MSPRAVHKVIIEATQARVTKYFRDRENLQNSGDHHAHERVNHGRDQNVTFPVTGIRDMSRKALILREMSKVPPAVFYGGRSDFRNARPDSISKSNPSMKDDE